MNRLARLKSQESGIRSDLSDFTCDLLENLKGEFKNNLKRSANQPSKENKLSLSLLADALQGSNGNPNSISDEIFIFNHIVNCTKSLVEVIDQLEFGKKEKSGRSVFYSGLLEIISKLVKSTMIFPSKDATTSTSAHKEVYRSDVDRLYLTSHSLITFPQLASNTTRYSSKNIPLLHYTVYNSTNLNLVKAVYYSNPDAIKSPDGDGALPLHWAALGTDTRVVQFLLDKYPAAAGEGDAAGYIPLHWAVNQDVACVGVYKLLINAYPQGASVASPNSGTLPLHWCVNRSEPDINLVKELIMAHSAGLRTPCRDGWLPLHYCVNRSRVSFDILSLLLNRYPNATMYKNQDGQVPVHRLLDRDDCSKKALNMIIKSSSECLMVPDNQGYLPLHVALDGTNPPSWRLIKLLLQHAPEAVQMKTKNSFLPLHIAMKMTDAHGTVQHNGGDGASQISKAGQCDDDALSEDEFNDETIAKLNANRYLSIVQELTSLYPEAVHDVAIDVVPTEANVTDIFTYEGGWKKSRWTPMSRAISKGKNSPIALLLRPFQKQKKPPTIKDAGQQIIAANRMGSPLASIESHRKLGPVRISVGGEKVPRRPPPRAKKTSTTEHENPEATKQNQSESVKKSGDKEIPKDEMERLKKEHEEAHDQAGELKSQESNAVVKTEAGKMAEENKAKPRIYTADMKEAGFYDDNDVTMMDDENALKFNNGDSFKSP